MTRMVSCTCIFADTTVANTWVLSGMQVIITTYELVLKDASILNQIKWNYMMVDEAHRLKNHESALYQEMTQFSFKNRLLITGQPLTTCLSVFLLPLLGYGLSSQLRAAWFLL